MLLPCIRRIVGRPTCGIQSTRDVIVRRTGWQRARAACDAADAAIAAAAACEGSEPASSLQTAAPTSDERRPRRKPAAQPTKVLQAGAAALAGPLPDVLAATFPDTFPTLSAARRVIRKDCVLVDGQLGSCKTEVAAGQQLQQLEPVSKHKAPRAVSLQVLYEDDHLAVVHKPWGVKMYGGDSRRTVTGALRGGALNPSPNPDALPEPKPLHRLDAAVGGVLLIAKTASAAAALSLQFKERRVHKVYHALLCGQLTPGSAPAAAGLTGSSQHQEQQQEEQENQGRTVPSSSSSSSSATESSDDESSLSDQEGGEAEQMLPVCELLQRQLQGTPAFTTSIRDLADPVLLPLQAADHHGSNTLDDGNDGSSAAAAVSMPIHSSSSSGSGLEDQLGPDVHVIDLPVEGKPSYSLYQVLGYSRSSRYGGWVSSVALSPVTGRKHQLRRHMAALGCPMVGDGKYATNKDDHISNQGIYLESLEIAFTHPSTQQRVHIKMPEPVRFATMRQQLHNRWRKLSSVQASDASTDS